MITELENDVLQNVWLCATVCNYVNMNKSLFALNAFNQLILTFKIYRSAKIPEILEKLCFHGNNLRL